MAGIAHHHSDKKVFFFCGFSLKMRVRGRYAGAISCLERTKPCFAQLSAPVCYEGLTPVGVRRGSSNWNLYYYIVLLYVHADYVHLLKCTVRT